ncbi:MAG: DUF4160 domain-containing protein [Acidobacteria bacterium]|nr:DUF4160 domain-containing protein [Acidobacteriota bacterium]
MKSVATLETLGGSLPPRAYRMVLEWAIEHREELHDNWQRAETHRPLKWIESLG